MMWEWDWHSWTWGMGIMMFLMVVFWSLVVGFIIWLIIRLTKRDSGSPEAKRTAMDIARERYARGEITKEQFDQIRKDLS
jgi:putative membrane protein